MTLTPSLPAVVEVNGQKFTIHKSASLLLDPEDMDTAGALGSCDRDALAIVLRETLVPGKMREVLLHEVLHAIVGAFGFPFEDRDGEERLVRQLAPALLGTLRANPDLVEYLQA